VLLFQNTRKECLVNHPKVAISHPTLVVSSLDIHESMLVSVELWRTLGRF
jgi:hypothetical protein